MSSMEVLSTIAALRAWRRQAGTVALVPTMGNLHAGHLALVDAARALAETVVVSIFVNPLQFGPREDYARYPRTLPEDCRLLKEAGCAAVFAPGVEEMYPASPSTFVLPPLADELCGAFRPGHFRGVATVVAKLFNIVEPQFAVFGKKDYQQLMIVKNLVRDLDFPVEIVAEETVRAPDGLALSSRNAYLTPEQRREAPRLYRMLCHVGARLAAGARDFSALAGGGRAELESHGWRVDYVEIRDRETLAQPSLETGALVVLAAAWLGETRLIDNVEVVDGRVLSGRSPAV